MLQNAPTATQSRAADQQTVMSCSSHCQHTSSLKWDLHICVKSTTAFRHFWICLLVSLSNSFIHSFLTSSAPHVQQVLNHQLTKHQTLLSLDYGRNLLYPCRHREKVQTYYEDMTRKFITGQKWQTTSFCFCRGEELHLCAAVVKRCLQLQWHFVMASLKVSVEHWLTLSLQILPPILTELQMSQASFRCNTSNSRACSFHVQFSSQRGRKTPVKTQMNPGSGGFICLCLWSQQTLPLG